MDKKSKNRKVKYSILCPAVSFLVLSLCLVFGNPPPGVGANIKSVKRSAMQYYYGRGVTRNYIRSLELYRQAAEMGDIDSQFIVGSMYYQGLGTQKNMLEAFRWLHMAAKSGKSSKESERILGTFFLDGSVVPQNYKEALQWYLKAANAGDAEAQSNIAYIYYSGMGVEQDPKQAFTWFKKAASQGLPMAQYNVGLMWYLGRGVDRVDMVRAYAWFNLASGSGNSDALSAKNTIARELSPEELTKAQTLSTEIFNAMLAAKNKTIP